MSIRSTAERILIVGDASSADRAGITATDSCRVDVVSSIADAAAKQAAEPYDRVLIDPSALTGQPLQVICAHPSYAGEALNTNEERFHVMADSISVMLWVTDHEDRVEFVNRAYCEFFGVDMETIQSGRWQALVHSDDVGAYAGAFEQSLKERKPFRAEARVRRADGEWRWIESYASPRFSESGEFLGMAGSSSDITDRKRAQDALVEQGQLLTSTLEATHAQIAYLDRDFRFVMANRSYIAACGHTWKELAGRSHFEIFPDAENEAIFARVRDTGEPVEVKAKPFEYADQPWRGVTYWDWTLVPVKDIGGAVTGLVFSLVDVTHDKQAEQEILRTNERLRILSDTASALLLSEKPQEIVQALCERVMKHVGCDVFFNFLAVDEKRCLHLNAYAGLPAEEARKIEWLDYGAAVCGCVARDGCRIVAEDIANTPDPRTELVRGYGIQAYACHPLLSQGGKPIGTLSFGTKSRPSFTDDELALMKTVADQVATAMERIRVLERKQHVAQVLQDAIIPPEPPKRIGSYRFAVRYRAALDEASVGGDFYDVFEIGDGRIGVLIGDVAGKGLEAAISVAAVRHSVRGYAYVDPSPGRVLTLTNDALCRDRSAGGKMLTAFHAIIDARAGTMAFANAGHEPAIIMDGEAHPRDLRLPGIPLGVVDGYTFAEESIRLRAGDRIILLTDGITGARRPGPQLLGIQPVLDYLAGNAGETIEALADGVLRLAADYVEDVLQDDAAIVVIELAGPTAGGR